MPFNITPPFSIVHMFENWLNGVVKSKEKILEWVYAPVSRQYDMFGMMLSLTNNIFPLSCRLLL
jgi:hypothetical protein